MGDIGTERRRVEVLPTPAPGPAPVPAPTTAPSEPGPPARVPDRA